MHKSKQAISDKKTYVATMNIGFKLLTGAESSIKRKLPNLISNGLKMSLKNTLSLVRYNSWICKKKKHHYCSLKLKVCDKSNIKITVNNLIYLLKIF